MTFMKFNHSEFKHRTMNIFMGLPFYWHILFMEYYNGVTIFLTNVLDDM
jgi:hypothetical protein